MTVESATYISDLNASNPAAGDSLVEGDDHIRLVKSTVKATFPNVSGAVTPTHTELNYVDGVTSAIQTQLDAKAALTQRGLVLISEQTASASASIAFTSGIDSTYDEYELHIVNLVPATNSVNIRLRTSTDGGSNYATTSADYTWNVSTNGVSQGDGGTATYIDLSGNQAQSNTTANGGMSLVVRFFNPAGTTHNKQFIWAGIGASTSNILGSGARAATADVDAIQISATSGNITSGHFKLFGVKKS